MYTPAEVPMRPSLFVHSLTGWGPAALRANGVATSVSTAWPSANRIIFVPCIIPSACTLYRAYWHNGATVGTNNLQMGIYNDNDAGTDGPGTALFRGTSTLSAGANNIQVVNETDTPIPAGRFWLALWCNGTTATVFGETSSAVVSRNLAMFWETNASGLPTTATPVQATTRFKPVFGFTTVATP